MITALTVAATLLTAGCSKTNLKTAWASQEDRIDSFIESLPTEADPNNPDKTYVKEIVRNGGSNRVVLEEGSGEALEEGGTVTFYYGGYVFNGSISSGNLFATNHRQTATDCGWALTDMDFSAASAVLSRSSGLVTGLYNGLKGVKAGEHCYIVFSGQYGFGNKVTGTIPANSALLYEIWIESVSN